jgi:hypothetical protein
MVFSDTTNKNGLIQTVEFWTRMKDGAVTGTLLKQVTTRINSAFEKIMPILLQYNDQLRWDDTNHTDKPTGRFNIVANQNDYKIAEDDNSLDILNIVGVRVKYAASDTQYVSLERILGNDPRVPEILNPNTAITGQPTGFLELGNRIFFDIIPSTSITSGGEIIFQREQDYFASTDTTAEPGIPKPFHELLALYAALDWNMVNRTSDGNLISLLRERIKEVEGNLKVAIDMRNPSKAVMTPKRELYI